jgi:SAM-dependent methyltransferase
MDKHTGSSYDEIASKYADTQDDNPWNLYFERPGILRFLPDVSRKDVLDAGCGPGSYALHLVNQGAKVTAFDLNPFFVERTRQRTGNRICVHQADLAEPLMFCGDASFDLVVCILVLHYLKDWQPTLAEFHRVMRPEGLLIFSTHHPFTDLEMSPTDDYFSTDIIEDEWEIGKVRYYRRPLSRISHDLLQSGFVIEEIAEPQPVKPPDNVVFNSYDRTMKSPMRLLIRARKAARSEKT